MSDYEDWDNESCLECCEPCDSKELHTDTRIPPLDVGPCLCMDCKIMVLTDTVEFCSDEAAEAQEALNVLLSTLAGVHVQVDKLGAEDV